MSLVEHLGIQRKNLLRVLLYGLEAGVLCLVALWLLFDNLSFQAKLLVSGAFALGIFLIGAISVLLTSKSALEETRHTQKRGDTTAR